MSADDLDVEVDVAVSATFAPTRRRPWLTPTLLGLASFAITALAIQSAAHRQTPILDSMDIQPFAAAASLAYAWGSTEDALSLEHQVLALAERRKGAPPTPRTSGDPDFEMLRRMDADLAKMRLAVLEGAPRRTLENLCAAATIRCTPYTLEGLINMLKKQRHVGLAGAEN